MHTSYVEVILEFRRHSREGRNPSVAKYLEMYPQFSDRLQIDLIDLQRVYLNSDAEDFATESIAAATWSEFQRQLDSLFPGIDTTAAIQGRSEPTRGRRVEIGFLVERYLQQNPPLKRIRSDTWENLRGDLEPIDPDEEPKTIATRLSPKYQEAWTDLVVVLTHILKFTRASHEGHNVGLAFGRGERAPDAEDLAAFRMKR